MNCFDFGDKNKETLVNTVCWGWVISQWIHQVIYMYSVVEMKLTRVTNKSWYICTGMWLRTQLANFSQFRSNFCHLCRLWDLFISSKNVSLHGVGVFAIWEQPSKCYDCQKFLRILANFASGQSHPCMYNLSNIVLYDWGLFDFLFTETSSAASTEEARRIWCDTRREEVTPRQEVRSISIYRL